MHLSLNYKLDLARTVRATRVAGRMRGNERIVGRYVNLGCATVQLVRPSRTEVH